MKAQLIAAALAERCEDVVASFFGQATQTNQYEMRWGSKGSFALRRTGSKRGFWFDHEQGRGGDMLTLICREHGVGIADALKIAERNYLGGALPVQNQVSHLPLEPSDESKRRAALRMFNEGAPL